MSNFMFMNLAPRSRRTAAALSQRPLAVGCSVDAYVHAS
jgi:hypothetical protein